jgi:hypothetical protein
MTTRRALWVLIGLSGLFRLGWAGALGPGNDEAYHYLFTVHRDWSYFDHPPMLAVVGGLGIAATGGIATAFTLRLGSVVLFAGSTWLMARLTARRFGPRAGFLAALALNLSAYYQLAAGAFALPDGPLLFFWLLTLDRLAAAFDEPDRLPLWLGVGAAWGGAMLSKYHAVFLPAGAIVYILVEPKARACLKRPGPYLAALCGLLVFSPVILWNATHGWASFAFQGGRALGEWRLQPASLAVSLVGPALYLLPWIWAWLVICFIRETRAAIAGTGDRLLLCEAIVPLATFSALACVKPLLPHWTLVGYLSLFPLVGRDWAVACEAAPRLFRRRVALMAAVPVAVALVAIVEARTGLLQQGRPGGVGLLTASHDPTAEMTGWDQVAAELKRRGLLDQPGTFLFTSFWFHSGQLAFATRDSSTPVLCYNLRGDARSFAFWSDPVNWVGHDAVLVAFNDHPGEPQCFRHWFARIEPIGSFEVTRAGAAIRKVDLYRCVRQSAVFPFDHLGASFPSVQIATGRSKPSL